jgi:aminoglycoside 6'-N-acetyltransferase I
MIVKKATSSETKEVASLAVRMWKSHTIEELIEEFNEYICSEGAVFLMWQNDAAIGFAQCGLRRDYVEGTDSSPVGYLEGIFVEKEYRNQGVAKALLVECQKWARDMGCIEFASDCELVNEESLKFHLSMGFIEQNRIICFTKKL